MGDAHDFAIAAGFFGPGSDFEFFGECFGFDDEAMVARRLEWIIQAGEEAFAVVVDHVGLAVHEIFRTDDRATEGLAHGLVTKTDAEQWELAF